MSESQITLLLRKELESRDQRQKLGFSRLISAWQKENLKNLELEEEISSLKNHSDDIKDFQQTNIGKPSSILASRIEVLEQRLLELKFGKMQLQRTVENQETQISTLSEKISLLEFDRKSKELELEMSKEITHQVEIKSQELSLSLAEKDGTIRVLGQELEALKSDFVSLQNDNLRLKEENRNLIDQWLKKMNYEAQKLNVANELYNDCNRNRGPASLEFVDVREEDILGRASFLLNPLPSKPVITLESHHSDDILCLQVSREGRLLASGSANGQLKVISTNGGELLYSLSGISEAVNCIDFSSHDEFLLASSNDNNSACLWTLESGRLKHVLIGHVGNVMTCRFLRDRGAVTGSLDCTLKLWDLERGYCCKTFYCQSSCNDLTMTNTITTTSTNSLENHIFVSVHMDGFIRFWDDRTCASIKEINGCKSDQITSISSLSLGGGPILVSMARDNTIKAIDARTFKSISEMDHPDFRISHNQVKASVSSARDTNPCYVSAGSSDGSIFIWNVMTGSLAKKLIPNTKTYDQICAAVWNPMGDTLLYSASMKSRTLTYWH